MIPQKTTITREKILKAAVHLFAVKGFWGTSTAMLAKEAGVAEGTLFRHFKNKEEIFVVLLQHLYDTMLYDVTQYIEVQGVQTGIERIISIIKACYVFVRKNHEQFAIILRDAPGGCSGPRSATFCHSRTIYVLLQENFQKAIEQGQAEGCIRLELHPADTACLLTASLIGLMRTMHLNFLNPSEDMLQTFEICTRAILEKPSMCKICC